MNNDSVRLAVEALLQVRKLHRASNDEAAAQSLNQAYEIQAVLAEKIGDNFVGWKIGCTSKMAQEMSNTDEPFYGRMFAPTTFGSPATLDFATFFAPIVEPEIAFRFGSELMPRNSPYGKYDVMDAVDAMYPAIEIVEPPGLFQGFLPGLFGEIARDLMRSDAEEIEILPVEPPVEHRARI